MGADRWNISSGTNDAVKENCWWGKNRDKGVHLGLDPVVQFSR